MKPLSKPSISPCVLHFSSDFKNIEDLRTEISSCLVTGNNLWLSYDEGAGIERLTQTKTGYGYHKHFELTDFFSLPEDQDEVDMEALAYEAPYLWFCGSMSLKRDSPDPDDDLTEQLDDLSDIDLEENRFTLGCIPCIEVDGRFELMKETEWEGTPVKARLMRGGRESTELRNALLADKHIGKFMDIPCKDNGFDIEGLAIHDQRIFIGLRGPVLNGYAIILEIRCTTLDDSLAMAAHPNEDLLYRKHFVDLAGMGIRELNCDQEGNLLLLAGPTMDLDGTISIYCIDGGLPDLPASVTHSPRRLFDVTRGGELKHGEDKAEGMALIGDNSILITYDSPKEERLKARDSVAMDVFELR